MKRLLTIGLWMALLAIFVLAAAPSDPTVLAPTNNATYFTTIDLQCSGSADDDGDDIYYFFYEDVVDALDPVFYNSSCLQNWCNENVAQFPDSGGGNPAMALDSSPEGMWLAIAGSFAAKSVCERGDGENYFQTVAGTWAAGNTTCKALNASTENWHLAAIQSPEENDLVTQLCDDVNYCYIAGYAVTGSQWKWEYNRTNATELLQNTTAVNYTWALTSPTAKQWSCQACDDTSACSSRSEVRNLSFMNFTVCSAGDTGVALNLSFYNESNTDVNLSATVNSISFTFDSDDTYNYSYSTTEVNSTYPFCLTPIEASAIPSGNIKFSAPDFPQRTYYFNSSITGSNNLDLNLYLLGTTDGIYTTLQVFSSANQPLKDVTVLGESQIDAVFQNVVSGTTDDAGAVTFWVNPDNLHRFTFSLNGYDTYQTTITPTQSSYTITLASGSTLNETNYNEGISYEVLPSPTTLNNSQLYNFSFNLSSPILNLSEYGFELWSHNDTLLANVSAFNASGGFLNATANVSNFSTVRMDYYWIVSGNKPIGHQTWYVANIYEGEFSLMFFFNDLRNFTGSGFDDFSRAILALVLTLLIVGTVTFIAGIYSPLGILGLIAAMTWLFGLAGMWPSVGAAALGGYGVPIFVTLLLGGFLIYEFIK